MLLLQLTSDTASNVVDSVANTISATSQAAKIFSMLDVLIMPLILLCIFSAMKNLVAIGADKIDAIDFFAEFAIDLLSIFASFIIGRYFLENNTSSVLLTAVKVVGFMLVCVIVLCFFRRKIMDLRGTSGDNKKGVGKWLFGEYVLDIVCLFLIVIIL